MRKTKIKYLSVKEIQQVMKNGGPMPTAIFCAKKKDYIVKARGTIFVEDSNNSKGDFRL